MTTQNVQTSPNASGSASGFDVAALFRDPAKAAPAHQSSENSGESPLPEPEITVSEHDEPGGEQNAPGAGEGETVSVFQFGGADYTEEQVNEALQHAQTYARYNQSIAPVVENIKQFTHQAAQFQAMAVTETDNQIKELTAALQSGQLNAQDYQLTHQALQGAQLRKAQLNQAGQVVEQKRQQALLNARRANAQQVATTLARNGWTHEQMTAAQEVAKGVMNMEQFADVVSPAFMELLRDAGAYRAQRAQAAAKIQEQGKKVVKTSKTTTQAAPPKVNGAPKAGSSEWMSNLWSKGKK